MKKKLNDFHALILRIVQTACRRAMISAEFLPDDCFEDDEVFLQGLALFILV